MILKKLLNRNTFNCTWNFAHENTLFIHVRCAVKFIILQCMIPFEAWVCTKRYFTVFTEGLCLVPLYRPIATHLTIRVCLSATRGEIKISAHKMSLHQLQSFGYHQVLVSLCTYSSLLHIQYHFMISTILLCPPCVALRVCTAGV